MDPCQYAFNQQVIMRRLLSFLRQSQSMCSDIECVNNFSSDESAQQATATPESFMMMTVFCVIVGLFLFMTRPSSIRLNSPSDTKPSYDRSEPDDSPDPSQSAF